MSIKILNTESELNSFPSSQSVYLLSTTELEDTELKKNIILFRLQTENQLISLAEPYSYNLGYLKETFDTIDLNFTSESTPEGFKITCKPTKLLNLDSLFCLYISDTLSNKSLFISKVNSKSNSNITVNLKDNFNVRSIFNLKIEETSSIISNRNLVKLTLNGITRTVDIRSNNKVITDNVEVILEDTIYVKGEEFVIEVLPFSKATDELQTYIKTVNSKSIEPIPKDERSTSITNEDILNFYTTLNKKVVNKNEKSYPKYLDHNIFSVKLPEGYTIDKTSSELKLTINVAFNNYVLESIGLYNKEQKYTVNVLIDDFDNEIIFEINYSEDPLQTDQVVINMDGIV